MRSTVALATAGLLLLLAAISLGAAFQNIDRAVLDARSLPRYDGAARRSMRKAFAVARASIVQIGRV